MFGWLKSVFRSSTAKAMAKLTLELTVLGLDPRVLKPLVVGILAAKGVAEELNLEKELRVINKLYRYMGEPTVPEEVE